MMTAFSDRRIWPGTVIPEAEATAFWQTQRELERHHTVWLSESALRIDGTTIPYDATDWPSMAEAVKTFCSAAIDPETRFDDFFSVTVMLSSAALAALPWEAQRDIKTLTEAVIHLWPQRWVNLVFVGESLSHPS